MAKLTKEQIADNIARTGLPNPDFKLSVRWWLLTIIGATLMVGIAIYIGLQANADKVERQASSPHTTQAGKWMREVSALPDSPERQVFISELGVAMADGVITDEESGKLATDYTVLTGKAAKGILD